MLQFHCSIITSAGWRQQAELNWPRNVNHVMSYYCRHLHSRWINRFVEFSVAKATLQSQMSVRSFVRLSVLKQNPSTTWNHHPSSFIFHPLSFFNHPSSFFIHPSFISRLLSFSACLGLFFIDVWKQEQFHSDMKQDLICFQSY